MFIHLFHRGCNFIEWTAHNDLRRPQEFCGHHCLPATAAEKYYMEYLFQQESCYDCRATAATADQQSKPQNKEISPNHSKHDDELQDECFILFLTQHGHIQIYILQNEYFTHRFPGCETVRLVLYIILVCDMYEDVLIVISL